MFGFGLGRFGLISLSRTVAVIPVTPPTSFVLMETAEFLLMEDGVSFLGLES